MQTTKQETLHNGPPKRGLWGGGVALLGLGFLMLTAAGVGSYRIYQRQVTKYTSDSARSLPVVTVSPEELQEIESRMEAVQSSDEQEGEPEQLVLTAGDINALISQEQRLRGRVLVAIRNGQVEADVSLPTDGVPGAEGRYFNGLVIMAAALDDGELTVTMQQASVNGEPVPETIMALIRKQNFAKGVERNPELVQNLKRFDRLEIVEDKIILIADPKESDETVGSGRPADAVQKSTSTAKERENRSLDNRRA